MKLVPNAHHAWRWHSVQWNGAGVVLSAAATAAATASSAGTLGGVFPVWAVCGLFCAIFLAALVGRLLMQKPIPPRRRDPPDDDWRHA